MVPILAEIQQPIVYVDGFSGPADIPAASPAPPLLPGMARTHRANLAGSWSSLFVEERQDRTQ